MIRSNRYGFTLIEMSLSLVLASIVLLAITSAIVLAGKALPSEDNPLSQVIATGGTLTQITEDLRHALHFSEATANAVTFSVPDRDGDGNPERIRYHWSGTAGTPLYYSYNGTTDNAIVDAVDTFVITFDTASVVETYHGSPIKSAEVMLEKHNTKEYDGDFKVDDKDWISQTIRASLPSDAIQWSISRLFMLVKYEGDPTEQMGIQLQTVDSAGDPSGEVLNSIVLNESVFAKDHAWQLVDFGSSTQAVAAAQSIVAVFLDPNDSDSPGKIRYATINDNSLGYRETDDYGQTWKLKSDRSLQYYVYGHYWSPGNKRSLTREYYTRATINLQPTVNNVSVVKSACQLINRPCANAEVWRLTFDEASPTTLDSNADATADWVVRGGAAFSSSKVVDGVWQCNQKLDSRPTSTFTLPTTVAVRLRATSPGSDGAAVWINVDWDGSNNSGIYAVSRLEIDNTQTLTLYTEQPGDDAILDEVYDLPTSMIDLRLLIDPDHDEVAMFVNGSHRGTYNYIMEAHADDTPNVTLYPATNNGEVDSITLIVGGKIQ